MTRLGWASVVVVGLLGCPMENPGELVVEVTPSQLVGNAEASVRVSATTGTGGVGTGTVSLKASAGTLADETVTLDAYGTAKTTYTCDVALDADCTGRAIITSKRKTPFSSARVPEAAAERRAVEVARPAAAAARRAAAPARPESVA